MCTTRLQVCCRAAGVPPVFHGLLQHPGLVWLSFQCLSVGYCAVLPSVAAGCCCERWNVHSKEASQASASIVVQPRAHRPSLPQSLAT